MWALYLVAVWLCTEAVAFVLGMFFVAMFASKPHQVTTAVAILGSAMLVPPIISLVAWWRRRSKHAGGNNCPHCGYDLAGLAAGAVCPECGKLA